MRILQEFVCFCGHKCHTVACKTRFSDCSGAILRTVSEWGFLAQKNIPEEDIELGRFSDNTFQFQLVELVLFVFLLFALLLSSFGGFPFPLLACCANYHHTKRTTSMTIDAVLYCGRVTSPQKKYGYKTLLTENKSQDSTLIQGFPT